MVASVMVERSPLVSLVLALSDAEERLRRWGPKWFIPTEERAAGPSRALEYLRKYRDSAADLIVWLELKGRQIDADEIDDAMAAMFEVAGLYDNEMGLRAYPDNESPEPIVSFDELVDAIVGASSRLEDLLEIVPPEVWEGYDDA